MTDKNFIITHTDVCNELIVKYGIYNNLGYRDNYLRRKTTRKSAPSN
jgi:hypothetical protein